MSDTISLTADHDRSRERLYDVVASEDQSLREKRQAIVDVGTEYLGVSLGFVSEIDTESGQFEVLVSTDETILAEGSVYDLSRTYCRRCVETGRSLAVSDARSEGWADDPAYVEHGLGCHLGTPIHDDGDLVGTICFADRPERETEFSTTERAFVELAARLLGREREFVRHERELNERDERLDRREKELNESEQKYESLVETAPDAIFVADIETRTVVDANEAAADLVGVPAEHLVGMDMHHFHVPGTDDRHWAEFERFILTGDGTMSRFDDGSQVSLQRPDGERVPVEIAASTVELGDTEYVQGVMRDISTRRENERELRVKDRAIEAAPVGITIADASDGDNSLVYANERFEEMTGYQRSEVLGQNCRLLQGPETAQSAVAELGRHIDAEEPARQELLNYRDDGTPFWNELSISPVRDDSGEVTHFAGFQREVTDRKRHEELAGVLNRVLRHNLRNGLNVVLAHSSALQNQLGPEYSEAVTAIRDRAQELIALSEQARAIDSAVSEETAPAGRDVVSVVEDVAETLAVDYPDADIAVAAPDSQAVYATEAIRDVLYELGENAAVHGGPAATVRFEVTPATESGAVRVSVTDDGPGLPESEQTVLDRGYETPLVHSSGLGLWFVAWEVTGVGGSVDVTVDDGTTVTLSLNDPSAVETEECHPATFGP
ncbi:MULTISPECIES: PAS domain S-box protein [Salinibaculum]|uniref:PAS domain S-box protein n=1 Tax=Salinibaculum TaxID=2732368 RepID=UPI0030CF5460